jgi:predicted alpha/beta hydrolase
VRLRTADGCEVGATLHAGARVRRHRRAAILHGGAGIAARRYRRLAEFLAEQGVPTLTYDYRGIGMSRPASLRGFRARTADWVEYDAAAAIGWVRERVAPEVLIGLSHSIGGLALGGAPNAALQDRLLFVAPHTGYWADYRVLYRVPMAILWHGLMPLVTRAVGFFPARSLRLGEDLPAGVALEWAARRTPDLRSAVAGFEANRIARLFDTAAHLQRPATVLTMSDDAFATAAGAERLLACFPRLATRRIVVTPAEARVRRLGHFGYFTREAGAALWPRLLALLGTAAE